MFLGTADNLAFSANPVPVSESATLIGIVEENAANTGDQQPEEVTIVEESAVEDSAPQVVDEAPVEETDLSTEPQVLIRLIRLIRLMMKLRPLISLILLLRMILPL